MKSFDPYFMECLMTNASLSQNVLNKSWEGVLCTCNKNDCNNSSATDLHEMFKNGATTQKVVPVIAVSILFVAYLYFSSKDSLLLEFVKQQYWRQQRIVTIRDTTSP